MMPPDIIRKLEAELNKGITTKVQALYLMAAIRKLLEQPHRVSGVRRTVYGDKAHPTTEAER
jgi:hypothetical protein